MYTGINKVYTFWVLKFDEDYIKVGSYKTVRRFDNPLKATIYSSRKLAENRLSKPFWFDGNQITPTIVELSIDLDLTREVDVVSPIANAA